MESIFTIVFSDDTIFKGGDSYFDTKWMEIPDKKIRTIFYQIPKGDGLVMSGYDKYFHMVEVTKNIIGENKETVNLEFVYLLGKINSKVYGYKMDFKTGNLERIELLEKDKWIQELNPIIWK